MTTSIQGDIIMAFVEPITIKDAIDSGTTKAQIETSFKKIMSKVL